MMMCATTGREALYSACSALCSDTSKKVSSSKSFFWPSSRRGEAYTRKARWAWETETPSIRSGSVNF